VISLADYLVEKDVAEDNQPALCSYYKRLFQLGVK